MLFLYVKRVHLQREEVGITGGFTVDQKVVANVKAEEVTINMGIRTTNNKEINEKVLDNE